MLRWLATAFTKRQVKKTIAAAAHMTEDQRIGTAVRMLRALLEVEDELASGRGSEALHRLLLERLQRAQKQRHFAMQMGARSETDWLWNRAALEEDWTRSYLAARTNQMSVRAFRQIDAMVCTFVRDTLGLTYCQDKAAETPGGQVLIARLRGDVAMAP